MPGQAIVALTQLPERASADALAVSPVSLVAACGAACVSVGAPVDSLYHWRGEIETATEVPMVIKTLAARYAEVGSVLRARHPPNFRKLPLSPSAMDSPLISTGLPVARPARRAIAERTLRLAVVLLALAGGGARGAAPAPPELLEAARAFALSAQGRDAQTVAVRFDVADGYYLYRDKLSFAVSPGEPTSPTIPRGKVKVDQFFGKVEVLRGRVEVSLTLDAARPGATVTLVAESQGCADLGVCYPAQRQTLTLSLPRAGERSAPWVEAAPRKKSWFN